MGNKKLYKKIVKEIEHFINSGFVEKKEHKISIIKNFFEKGYIIGESEGYKKCEKDFNNKNMYLNEKKIGGDK